jgi:hypothetical protein
VNYNSLNNRAVGRNIRGADVGDFAKASREAHFGVVSVPKDVFVAEAQRRRLSGMDSE